MAHSQSKAQEDGHTSSSDAMEVPPPSSVPVPQQQDVGPAIQRPSGIPVTVAINVSTLTGNVVHLQVLPGTLTGNIVQMAMCADTWSCGTPVHLLSPLTINLSMAEMKRSGGNMRLSTWDGALLQDGEVIPASCNFFKLVFMKQVGNLPQGPSSFSRLCADTSQLGQLSPQDAHILKRLAKHDCSRISKLLMGMNSKIQAIEAALNADNSLTVDISGTQIVVNLVYGKPLVIATGYGTNGLNVLGILHQHPDTKRQCTPFDVGPF